MATTLRIPKPQKYLLEYKGKEGKKTYTVSLPIDMNAKTITVYAYGGGVKSFKVENIVSMNLIGESVLA